MDWFVIIVIFVLAIGLIAAWFLRDYLTGGSGGGSVFGGGRDKRLGVLETTPVDGRRKLVLLTRDGVEHLIMVGGPIDIVIESGIQPQRRAPAYDRYPPQQQPSMDPGDASAQPSFGRARVAAGSRPLEP